MSLGGRAEAGKTLSTVLHDLFKGRCGCLAFLDTFRIRLRTKLSLGQHKLYIGIDQLIMVAHYLGIHRNRCRLTERLECLKHTDAVIYFLHLQVVLQGQAVRCNLRTVVVLQISVVI